MLIRGQGAPSCILSGNWGNSSGHGQPSLAGGGGGDRDFSVGQCIDLLFPGKLFAEKPSFGPSLSKPEVYSSYVLGCDQINIRVTFTKRIMKEFPCRRIVTEHSISKVFEQLVEPFA